MKKSLSVLTLCFAASAAQATCFDWKETPPSIPAGGSASLQEMYTAQEKVKTYVKEGAEELECTSRNMTYNYILYRMKTVANTYNEELHAFRSKVAQR